MSDGKKAGSDANAVRGTAGSDSRPPNTRESVDYIVRLLQFGIRLNGMQYRFYGRSNSQLGSRTYFLYPAPKLDVSRKSGARKLYKDEDRRQEG